MASVKGVFIVTLEAGKGRIKHFPARDDDDVQPGRDLMTPEDLPSEPLRAIPLNRRTKLAAGGDSQPRYRAAVRCDKERHEARRNPHASRVRPFEVRSAANSLGRREPERSKHGFYCSSETVSLLRPLARRRLSTIRPFLVAMRTLKPWVFLRRRVFG
jgi:hypothetical protein